MEIEWDTGDLAEAGDESLPKWQIFFVAHFFTRFGGVFFKVREPVVR